MLQKRHVEDLTMPKVSLTLSVLLSFCLLLLFHNSYKLSTLTSDLQILCPSYNIPSHSFTQHSLLPHPPQDDLQESFPEPPEPDFKPVSYVNPNPPGAISRESVVKVETSKLLKIVAHVEFLICVEVDSSDKVLNLDEESCVLFCFGRSYNYAHVAVGSKSCFCSKLPKSGSELNCRQSSYFQFKLTPRYIPKMAVSVQTNRDVSELLV